MEILVKFKAEEQRLSVLNDHTLGDVKNIVAEMFGLDVNTVKLLGIKVKDESANINEMNLKNLQKVIVIGSKREDLDEMKALGAIAEQKRREEMRVEEEKKRIREKMEAEERLMRIEREEQEMKRRQEEIMRRKEIERVRRAEAEERKNGVFKFAFQCFASSELDEFKNENRIVLAPRILETLIQNECSFPIIFKISKRLDDQSESTNQLYVFAGVKDFNGVGDEIASVPSRLLEQLGAENGEMLKFETFKVHKGEFIRLLPQNANWTRISSEEREALLEFELRKIQYLAQGNILTFYYDFQDFKFRVELLKPANIISLADTELETEILDPEEKLEAIPFLVENEKLNISLREGESMIFQSLIKDPHIGYKIDLINANDSSNFSLYASFDTCSPSFEDFSWCSQRKGSNSIMISNEQPEFKKGTLYISIFCHSSPKSDLTPCTLSLSSGELNVLNKGHKMTSLDDDKDSALERCSNCKKNVPSASIYLHQIQCQRNNWHCEACGITMHKSEKEMHLNLKHIPIPCRCGSAFEQDALMLHKKESCQLRLVRCIYCPLRIPLVERGPHQADCGNRFTFCKHCGSQLKRKEVKRHLTREHSIAESDITYSDYR